MVHSVLYIAAHLHFMDLGYVLFGPICREEFVFSLIV